MAESRAVWGIDIGQAGLKAVRLRYAESAEQALAVAFDYVPHPKILSQPDAVVDELVAQALETFLSRNEVEGDLIGISLPGQTALARFIQLPPVESNKVAEIVKYEARQQIPFALEDVIWDFQTLGGGIEESGFMLGAEVGLFAMKRDQVAEHMAPYMNAKMEVELVQIAPLAMHNFLCYDIMGMRTEEESVAGDDHYIVLDMGADNTTLLVTNGEKIWIRNVPIGGNHFTRALTKEMKLTFAKAEHLKCNATKSPDPRAVFQALRPVFNDYVAEIQRSIGYFSSVNREAKISKIIGAGNGFKLAGLQKFLQQNLQYDVERVETLQAVVGDTVLNAPLFQENIMSFVVPYGLALQLLQLTPVRTTLLPPEIATARQIRRKKPWAVSAAAVVLCGMATSVAGYANVASSVSSELFSEAESSANNFKSKHGKFSSDYESENGKFTKLLEDGLAMLPGLEQRTSWHELYRALNECYPRDTDDELDEEDPMKRNRMFIGSVTAAKQDKLEDWFKALDPGQTLYMLPQEKEKPPAGEGYVITIKGWHLHNVKEGNNSIQVFYVVETLLRNLQQWQMQQPGGLNSIPVRQMGITHATVTNTSSNSRYELKYYVNGRPSDRSGVKAGGFQRPGGRPLVGARPPVGVGAASKEPEYKMLSRTLFTVQFVWQPIPVDQRLVEDPIAKAAAEAAAKEAAANPPATPAAAPGTPEAPATPGTPPTTPATPGTPATVPGATPTTPGTTPTVPGATPTTPGATPTTPGATPAPPATPPGT